MLLVGDAAERLRELPDRSVHCCITSPPYLGLRDYGIEGQIGLERTPAEYVGRLVAVFAEVHRVLRDDGTLWIVIGDSYARNSRVRWDQSMHRASGWKCGEEMRSAPNFAKAGFKPKNLLGIPWRLAFALQDAGWYLRQEIIWAKSLSGPVYRGGSCMPEAVKDRCTRAHETIFMLAKRARYFYDVEAVKEPTVSDHAAGNNFARPERKGRGAGSEQRDDTIRPTRNMRDVWHINPKPFKEAHFATFPPALVEPMILAGTSEKGVCVSCGAPWRRLVNVDYTNPGNRTTNGPRSLERRHETAGFTTRLNKVTETTGWQPTCTCDAAIVPAVVLDPFAGAGTTGLVAQQLGREFIGIELNSEYVEIAERRLSDE